MRWSKEEDLVLQNMMYLLPRFHNRFQVKLWIIVELMKDSFPSRRNYTKACLRHRARRMMTELVKEKES